MVTSKWDCFTGISPHQTIQVGSLNSCLAPPKQLTPGTHGHPSHHSNTWYHNQKKSQMKSQPTFSLCISSPARLPCTDFTKKKNIRLSFKSIQPGNSQDPFSAALPPKKTCAKCLMMKDLLLFGRPCSLFLSLLFQSFLSYGEITGVFYQKIHGFCFGKVLLFDPCSMRYTPEV